MPILIIITTTVILFLWYNWGRDKARSGLRQNLDPVFYRMFRKKKCQWVKSDNSGGNLKEFRCQTCGVTAYSSSDHGPQECKRDLHGRL